jgi:hypothetical protein
MYQEMIKELSESSVIAIIAGKRGSGKTACGCRLMENIQGKRKYALGIRRQLPGIASISDINQAGENSAVLVDEAGISYNSRDAMKKGNKDLSELMLIARHKSLTLIFISQNTANLEINIIRQADMLILKECALLQLDMERPAISKHYRKAMEEFKTIQGDKRQYAYVVNSMEGMVKMDLPSFWNDSISKSYSDNTTPTLYNIEEEALTPEIVEEPRRWSQPAEVDTGRMSLTDKIGWWVIGTVEVIAIILLVRSHWGV